MPRSSFLFFFCTHSLLLLQSLIERFSSHLIEFCAVFAISCKVACSFHFTLCEHEPESVGSCPQCWNLSFAKLNWTLSTLFYCFCFPPLNSWSDWFYFVTKSSGMTCNTPNLAFNPQCNSKEIKLRAALRANLHSGWLLRFLSSGSKWAKSIRNAVSFGNEETQASLWREEPGLHADWKAAYSQWDP